MFDRVASMSEPFTEPTDPASNREPGAVSVPPIGTMLGNRFLVIALLGKGAGGTVYRANDRIANRDVALKFLTRDVVDRAHDGGVAELQAFKSLDDDRIVKIDDFHALDGYAFLSMELVEGPTLTDFAALRREDDDGSVSADELVWILEELGEALVHVQAAGIVHGDVKPENALLTGAPGSGRLGSDESDIGIKLTDFGLSSLSAVERARAGGGRPRGTLLYMAPEVLEGPASATAASDVYSLCATLYALATGEPPFPLDPIGGDLTSFIDAVREGERTSPDTGNPRLDALILAGLSAEVGESGRPRTARELLERWRSPGPILPADRPPEARRSRKGAMVALASVAAIAASVYVQRFAFAGSGDWTVVVGSSEHTSGFPERVRFEPTGQEFVLVLFGSRFTIGRDRDAREDPNDSHADEEPEHLVSLSQHLYVACTETTVGQWRRFVEDTGHVEPELEDRRRWVYDQGERVLDPGASWERPLASFGDRAEPEHPVTQILWSEVDAYCSHFGLRLPTEAEWETFARASKQGHYWWGRDASDSAGRANFAGPELRSPSVFPRDPHAGAAPVGSYEANPWGLRDILGNAAEFVADAYDPEAYHLRDSPALNPIVNETSVLGDPHVYRGGSWATGAWANTVTYRTYLEASESSFEVGFRAVVDAESVLRRL